MLLLNPKPNFPSLWSLKSSSKSVTSTKPNCFNLYFPNCILSLNSIPFTFPSSSSNSISLFVGEDVFEDSWLYLFFALTQSLHFSDGSQLVEVDVSTCTLNFRAGVTTDNYIV